MIERIFLGGGGDEKASKNIDDLFIRNVHERGLEKVVYIPIALTSKPYRECFKWFSSIFETRVPKIEMWESLEGKSLRVDNKLAVYIGGGNTTRLMGLIYASNFDKEIKDFALNGGLVYGGSAGAIILGNDIGTAPEFTTTVPSQGLNLLGDYSIACHYNSSDSERLTRLCRDREIKIIAIEEDAGVIFDGKEITTVGPGNIYLFSQNKKIKLESEK